MDTPPLVLYVGHQLLSKRSRRAFVRTSGSSNLSERFPRDLSQVLRIFQCFQEFDEAEKLVRLSIYQSRVAVRRDPAHAIHTRSS